MRWAAVEPKDEGYEVLYEGEMPFDPTVEPKAAKVLAAMGSGGSQTAVFLTETMQQFLADKPDLVRRLSKAKDFVYTLDDGLRKSDTQVVVPFKIWFK